ncbi:hypothetical protein BV20DRAFT_564558 [Pilatotrama ljubarskyi]|nr:hypothetical protein BV20DRAFT_564558 [Pilatotrama ljubarskyi]
MFLQGPCLARRSFHRRREHFPAAVVKSQGRHGQCSTSLTERTHTEPRRRMEAECTKARRVLSPASFRTISLKVRSAASRIVRPGFALKSWTLYWTPGNNGRDKEEMNFALMPRGEPAWTTGPAILGRADCRGVCTDRQSARLHMHKAEYKVGFDIPAPRKTPHGPAVALERRRARLSPLPLLLRPDSPSFPSSDLHTFFS